MNIYKRPNQLVISSALLLLFLKSDGASALLAVTTSKASSHTINKGKLHHEPSLEIDNGCIDHSKREFVSSILAGTAIVVTATVMSFPAAAIAQNDLPLSGASPTARQVIASSSTTTTATTAVAPSSTTIDYNAIISKASKKALGGGKAGASAAVVQVCTLMWLRTAMNYQYVYGGNLVTSLQTLWAQGGLARLYQGLPFALLQGPLTRFGDTAANVGILALLESQDALPLPIKTACGSAAAGLWRIFLMPVDTSKTAMQVQGREGLDRLIQKVKEEGPSPLYQGALASASATAAGHFPWFLTFNFLNDQLPIVTATDDLLLSLLRSAFLGLSASCVSDCCSNSLRVIKTTKQTAGLAEENKGGDVVGQLTYQQVVKTILETDGIAGLFGRGLQTRLLTNAIQGAAFSVLWKYFQQVGGTTGT